MAYKLWIDGEWTEGKGKQRLSVENPATGEKIDEVVNACEADVNDAVAAAKKAFYDGRWSGKTPSERSVVLDKMADLLEARMDELARIEAEDTGKPYEYLCKGVDFPFGIDNLRFSPRLPAILRAATPANTPPASPPSIVETLAA